MAQKVAKVGISKEDGYLYYVDKQGDISQVGIKSLKGNTCKLQNPWPGKKVVVYSNNELVKTKNQAGDVISFTTKADREYSVRLAGASVDFEKIIYDSEPNERPKKLGQRTLGKISGWNKDF